jgi:hypothetical protein
MYLACDAAAMATKDAHLMTALAVFSGLVAALCIGYHFGRRAGSTPSTWKMRTSRTALGRLAITLLGFMIARRIRRTLLAERGRPAALAVWVVKLVEPLQLFWRTPPEKLQWPARGRPRLRAR